MIPARWLFRLQRGGFLAVVVFSVDFALINAAGFRAFAGHTPAEQARFGAQITALGAQITWLLPLPLHPETVGGFTQWRVYGTLSIAFATWALLSACGAMRRDEERGLIEQWIAIGVSRTRLLLSRGAAFAALSAYAAAAAGFATWLGSVVAGMAIGVTGIAGVSVALWALALASYGIALVVTQQAITFRSAVSASAVVLLLMFLLDSLARSSVSPSVITNVSVFSLYDKTNAIAPSGTFDVAATLILFAVAAVAIVLAVAMFNARDVGASWLRLTPAGRPAVQRVSVNPFLRVPVIRQLYWRRFALLFWIVGFVALAAFSVSLLNATFDLITKNPSAHGFLRNLSGDLHVVLLALIWFGFAQLLVSILAVVNVARWAGEDGNGILEMKLAHGVSRTGVVVERGAELLFTLAVVVLVSSVVVLLVAQRQNLDVPVDRLSVAAALLLPFGLTFGAAGALFAAYRPRVALGVLSTVAVVSYLLYQLAPAFKWPSWIANLSVFQLYGTPLVTPVFVGGLLAMLAVVAAGFTGAAIAMSYRDIAR
jgi:ABC-2 type transport system permease protein